ncbi:hypothetical protein GA0070622_1179 [Micromonospora sediminicola]|uniref:Uncharacterized protein n=1 Tax=Micromonospora sediminicola TaxID=946078 RepID=A0A1A9B5A1_9ACTN|nr:hypothetical protein [Micromonospora sediminicola]SBT64209.1 hypothetical protein GA0070622_1179 [Micromonospora sediminicola]
MTLIGWTPGPRSVREMLALYPGTGIGRIFVEANKALHAWDGPVLGPLVAAGVPAVHLSYKTNPPADVRAWADRKPAGLRLFLTEDHEPEQGPESGDPTLDDFHAQQAALVAAFDGHPARADIWLGPVFTRYWWQKFAGDGRWMPRQLVDFIAWDIYNDGPKYRTAEDLLSIPRQVAEQLGVPYLVAELGAKRQPWDVDGTGQAGWAQEMVDALRADGALAAQWFHKGGCDLTLAGSEPARQTWQAITLEEVPVATTAPQTLLDARRLLLDHLGGNGLEPAEVGIVGDPAHRGGYHCGSDRVVSGDYSVVESPRDRTGLSSYACALDIGTFTVTIGGRRHDLQTFSTWLARECAAGATDTRDIREVIYSPDGSTVRRWDRLGKRASGDDSHRWHTHISYHRDAIKAGRDQTALFRRYLTTIGLLEDEMAQFTDAHARLLDQLAAALPTLLAQVAYTDGRMEAFANGRPAVRTDLKGGGQAMWPVQQLTALPALIKAESTSPPELATALAALPRPAGVDVDQLAAAVAERVLAGLPAADGPVSRDDLEAALRSVLGSLDGAGPQA